MAITRKRKEELVAQYSELLGQTTGFVIAHYTGLSVAETDDLRTKLIEAEGEFVVTKNTLFKIALESNDWPIPEDQLTGPVGVGFGNGNMPGVAKAMLDFAKDHPEKFEIIGGVMTGDILDPAKVKAISDLPTLDELRSQLAGLMIQPATGLATVLDAATAQVARVLQAYITENGGGDGDGGGDAEAAA